MIIAVWHVGNASIPEIVWTFFGLVGLFFNIKNTRSAMKSLTALEKMNGRNLARLRLMKILATARLRTELLLTYISSAIMLVGFLAMLAPPTDSSKFTPKAAAITFGFFTIEFTVVLISVLNARVIKLLEREG